MTYFSSFVNKIQPGFFVKYLPTCKMNRYQRFESHLLGVENGKHRMSYIYVHKYIEFPEAVTGFKYVRNQLLIVFEHI